VKLATRALDHAQQVQIPAGEFIAGDVPLAYDATDARKAASVQWAGQPPRNAKLPSFWIDLHEVTRDAYGKCVAAGACTDAKCEGGVDPAADHSPEIALKLPQTCVTHAQAREFCRAKGLRLPSADEWEYAARGTDARRYPWGNDIRDEYTGALVPVGGPLNDPSYFGILGMGTSATEWADDELDPEASLRAVVERDFRRDDGPLRRALRDAPKLHVIRHANVGARDGASGTDPKRGFRCAADLDAATPSLDVPVAAPKVPLVRASGSLAVFGGVAEAVDRAEAETFCNVLAVDDGGTRLTDWRLPTLADIQAIAAMFRGPGPFWTADGAAVQTKTDVRHKPDDPWAAHDADPQDPLLVRCVRDVK
jgi:formylglycine-generating enzyme required for sulfatase activity